MDLYTRESGKVGCIIYATGQEKEEAAESYPETEPWSTTGSVTGAATYRYLSFSLSLFSSPYPFLFDPLVKGLGTPRVACPVIPVKRIISLFETLAILWSPPLFIPGRWVGWWRVARCASSLFVSSYSPVFRTRGDTRVRVHAVYYTVRRREWPSNARPRCLLRGARHVEAVGAWNSRRQTGGEGGVDGLSTAGRVAIPPRLLLQNTLINDSSEQIYLHY